VYIPHYDEKKWLEPYKFVPERHDPDSEFSRKALAAGKKADIYSRRNFGHGLRSCPGKTLAFYNMRVVVTYLLSTIDYEVMDDLLTKEGVGFGLGSLILPQFKITKL
jgi:cytochrome P450